LRPLSGQHLQGLVAGDGADFHKIQFCVLEKAVCGFVAEVMENQAAYLLEFLKKIKALARELPKKH